MSTTSTSVTFQPAGWATDKLTLSLKGEEAPQWQQDLIENGYAVVKGAIPRDRADGYANEMYQWLEDL